jgi:hypothetical protein
VLRAHTNAPCSLPSGAHLNPAVTLSLHVNKPEAVPLEIVAPYAPARPPHAPRPPPAHPPPPPHAHALRAPRANTRLAPPGLVVQ